MSDLRAAAQQALLALEAVDNDEHGKTSFPATVYTAIIKLRAALAQPAVSGEPVAHVSECEACFTPDACQLRGTCDHYAAEKLRIAAAPQPAPARVPLTDEQLWQSDEIMSLNADFGWPMETIVMFCRVIEAAHGIKAKEAP